MEKVDKPLSTVYIHSVYSGSKTTRLVDQKKSFQSTSQFDRDPAHSGQAPEHPTPGRKPYRK
ncbi:hypothetical protein DyAD56_08485 [Dyella sp. AD56]|nr:hypothetical protein DyAD56_08485 [Dyella sp. AD56]ULU24583.1 hypothetical protein DYST_01500 [Dyella terrae]